MNDYQILFWVMLFMTVFITTYAHFLVRHYHKHIKKLQRQLATATAGREFSDTLLALHDRKVSEAEQLLKEIIPLIPDFNSGKEHNEPITKYQYLKYDKRWQKGEDK